MPSELRRMAGLSGRAVRAPRWCRKATSNGPPSGIAVLDASTAAVAVFAMVQCLRASARSPYWPLIGLIVPALRLALSPVYRGRMWAWSAAQWVRVRAFGEGRGPIPWAAAVAFVAGPFFLFDLTNGKLLGAVDTRPVIPTAVSLVREGNWDLSEFARDPTSRRLLQDAGGQLSACFQAIGGRIYSAFPPGMVPFAVAVVAPARLCGANLDKPQVQYRLEKLTAAVVAAVALDLFFLTASCLGSPEAAWVGSAFLGTGSALLTTAGLGLWQHGGVMVWLLTALLVEFRTDGRPGWRGTAVQGIACGLMLSCRPTAVLLVGLFGLWVLVRSPARAVAMGAIAALAYAPWLAMYQVVYGNPFGPQTMTMNTSGQYWTFFRVPTMLGVLIGPARGLFVYQPWAVLALAGAWCGARARGRLRGGPPGWKAFAVLASAAHAFIISAWHDWSGGYCWGSRLLTDILPLVGLLAVPAIAALLGSRRGRGVLVAAGVASVLPHLPCVLWDADLWNYVTDHWADLWSWSNAPFFFRPGTCGIRG